MNIHNSYFAITNPLAILDHWLNPHRHESSIDYHGKTLRIIWTRRAGRALRKRPSPLIVEMQIYFSCVVQKRVLFHDQTEYETVPVNDLVSVVLRPVQADSCDPVEFAKNHPVAHEYSSNAARKLRPSELQIDYKDEKWFGEFAI